MTRHVEIPLRPHAVPWPGLATRTGFLDPGVGILDDGSVNMMINRGDVLEKRKGFVRGLDEQFSGVVCGLFKYTDVCGVEHLLVADESSISIRQPFAVPIFENSDAYPFDSFAEDGTPNSYYWRNIDRYTVSLDELRMRAGVAESTTIMATSDIMRWFKAATNLSYQVRVEYKFDPDVLTTQQVAVVIKGNGDLSTGSYLLGQIVFGPGAYSMSLQHFDGTLITELGSSGVVGSTTNPRGFFTMSYSRDIAAGIFRPKVTVIPRGGNQAALRGTINAVQDASLGQISGIGIGFNNGVQPDPSILVVDGGPI